MKYVPNLIPSKSRVDLDLEFESVQKPAINQSIWFILSFVGSVPFLLAALMFIVPRFWQSLLLLVIGLALLPRGHRWIEEKLRFKFTWLIKTVFLSLLIVILIPVSQNYTDYYRGIEEKEQLEKTRQAEAELQKRLEEERKEKLRQDSLNYYSAKADEKIKAGQLRTAAKLLSSAIKFSNDQNDLIQKRADCFFRTGQLGSAISDYSSLINSSHNTGDNYFNRAQCYVKNGQIRGAVSDLKEAMQLGDSRAETLHEQINPLKRRVAYYVTRCCDGSTSNAKGRGACSHHHGVCNWNDPVYEEYRDY
jgi:tetratricopeptide (TPR) repeat protein